MDGGWSEPSMRYGNDGYMSTAAIGAALMATHRRAESIPTTIVLCEIEVPIVTATPSGGRSARRRRRLQVRKRQNDCIATEGEARTVLRLKRHFFPIWHSAA